MNRAALLLVLGLLPQVALCQSGSTLRFACEESNSRVGLHSETSESEIGNESSGSESIPVESLVRFEREGEAETARRSGSAPLVRRCGKLTVRIWAGYFNPNPEGELGAADDYPVVELLDDGGEIIGPIAIGRCTSDIARYSYMVECPRHWATQLTAFEGSGKIIVLLTHTYDEYLQP